MGAIRRGIEMGALGIESLAVAIILIATIHGTIGFILNMRHRSLMPTCSTRSGSAGRCC